MTSTELDRRSLIAQKIVSFHNKFSFEPPCEVRPSLVHGRGLFATTDVPANALLALYPPDAILIQDGTEKFAILLNPESTTVPPEEIRRAYGATIDENIVVVGYPDVDHGNMFQAHIANDGAKGSLTLLDPPEEVKREREVYTACSLLKQNAALVRHKSVPEWIVLRSTRPIRAGEEILITYGYGYWLGNNLYHRLNKEVSSSPSAEAATVLSENTETLLQPAENGSHEAAVFQNSENLGSHE
jgi:hypothetical protein